MSLPSCVRPARPICALVVLALGIPACRHTLSGWSGDMSLWHVAGGEVTGKSAGLHRNEFLCTAAELSDFELAVTFRVGGDPDRNSGVQFRSRRVPGSNEVSGYQADIGAGVWGALYDESRRKRMLAVPPSGLVERIVHREGWNTYVIRAQGPHITLSLNGAQTVDYVERDPSVAREGVVCLQMHAGGPIDVAFKDIRLRRLPSAPEPPGAFRLQAHDVIAFSGGGNLERMRFDGRLEALIAAASGGGELRFRNLAWEGDTVFEQWRDDSGESWRRSRDWRQLLSDIGATVVVTQFGQLESLQGRPNIDAFIRRYDELLAAFAAGGRRVVVLSPTPFGTPPSRSAPDLSARNADLAAYVAAVRDLAARRGCLFIDLFTPLRDGRGGARSLTEDGLHLGRDGQTAVADLVARALGLPILADADIERVRVAAVEMERLWFDTWRPMNWSFLEGDRVSVPFSRDWRNPQVRLFPEEMKQFAPILEQADRNIWLTAARRPALPLPVPAVDVEPPEHAVPSPADELAAFEVLPGYRVDLFASEADGVVKPTQIRWDERGRLWATCSPTYPQVRPGEAPHDYITVCDDRDGDGHADSCRKFADGLFMPSGLELGDGGVYVAQGTELLFFRDTDGDGRADERRIVLGGFGTADSHQMINSLRWGFAGELWFTQGHHIYSRVETPHGIESLNRAGVWRWRRRTLELDPFFQSSSAGLNGWGVMIDDFGQVFHKSGADVGGFYSVPGLVRSALPLSSEVMRLFKAAAKQVGMEIVESRHFPDEMQGRVVIGGYYDNTLQVHTLDEHDGLFSSRQLPSLIQSRSTTFRPIDVELGPDGAIYVADWTNPIIGHYQASYRHPDRDHTHGRIWRVRHASRPLLRPPPLAGASIEALLGQLGSPERWVRYQAKRLLFSRDSAVVVAALDRWRPGDDAARLQALSLYEAHEAVRPRLVESLLRSADFRVRAYATRAIGHYRARLPDAAALVAQQVADPHPRVRLEAVVAASYLEDPEAVTIAARALDRPMNGYLEHALVKAVNVTRPRWEGPLARDEIRFASPDHLLHVLRHEPIAAAPALLRRLAQSPSTASPEIARKALRLLAELGDARDLQMVFERALDDPELLDAVADASQKRQLVPSGDVGAGLTRLLDRPEPSMLALGVRLAGLWRARSVSARVAALASSPGTPEPVRREALLAVPRVRGAEAVPVLAALARDGDGDTAATALEALSQADLGKTAELTVAHMEAATDVPEMARWLAPVVRRAGGGQALARALELRPLGRAQAVRALSALGSTGHTDKALLAALNRMAGTPAGAPAYDPALIRELADATRNLGRAGPGREVFRTLGCPACHLVGGEGRPIGPDLSTLGRGLPLEGIIVEVLWPQVNVKEGFVAAVVTTTDGRTLEGLLRSNSRDQVTILETSTVQTVTMRRANVREVSAGGSVMPDGLTAALTRQQLIDLLRYLGGLGL